MGGCVEPQLPLGLVQFALKAFDAANHEIVAVAALDSTCDRCKHSREMTKTGRVVISEAQLLFCVMAGRMGGCVEPQLPLRFIQFAPEAVDAADHEVVAVAALDGTCVVWCAQTKT